MRLAANVLLSASLLCGAANPVWAAPLVYVYRGSSCDVPTEFAPFENMIGRKADGAILFNDYTKTPEYAVANLNYGLKCYQGRGYKIAASLPLAFTSPSTVSPTLGAYTLADVAAGKLDTIFAADGAALVDHGFANADIRLGWEENGNWYRWAFYKSPSTGRAAFARAYKILKATPGNHFTVWFNPTTGYQASQQNVDFPGLGNLDGIAFDVYANQWLSAGAKLEPALYNNELAGSWGINTIGTWYNQLPKAVPEFGVGSMPAAKGQGSASGKGAPDGAAVNGGDDPVFMANALAYFAKANVRFIGYWDVNNGDYNSRISDGSRPKEALAFLQAMGGEAIRAHLEGAALYAGPIRATAPVGMHVIMVQLRNGKIAILFWGDKREMGKVSIGFSQPVSWRPAGVSSRSGEAQRRAGSFDYKYSSGGLIIRELTP